MNVTNKILLDTNIVNYYLTDSDELKKFAQVLEGRQRALSFATVAELTFWQFQLINEQKKSNIDKTTAESLLIELNNFIIESEFIVPNTRIAQIAADLAFKYDKRKRKNKTKNIFNEENIRHSSRWHDFWIAATAIEKKLTLVTNNIEHFKKIDGLDYYDPEADKDS